MSAAPKYIDLDAVKPKVDVVVKLKGVEHKLKPTSLGDFIENTRQLQKLSVVEGEGDVDKSTELLIGIVQRAFPTITRDDLMEMTLVQLNALREAAMNASGQNEVTEEIKKEQPENPPTAG